MKHHNAAAPLQNRDAWRQSQREVNEATDLLLVAEPGFEPGTAAYETAEIPFLYPAIKSGEAQPERILFPLHSTASFAC